MNFRKCGQTCREKYGLGQKIFDSFQVESLSLVHIIYFLDAKFLVEFGVFLGD